TQTLYKLADTTNRRDFIGLNVDSDNGAFILEKSHYAQGIIVDHYEKGKRLYGIPMVAISNPQYDTDLDDSRPLT
ncbi:hypothetical protein HDU67_002938, partial [Dinochytrium kinnereticum]